MDLGQIIKKYRRENHMTMQEFADRCELSKGYISMLEKGQHPQRKRALVPSLETFVKLSGGMNMSVQELFSILDIDNWIEYGFDVDRKTSFFPENVQPLPSVGSIPLLGTIACGEPILAEENLEGEVDLPEHIHADFALRCKGDSMINARIFDGDIVYIRQQPIVEDGQIAAVLIGDEATLKRVHLFPDHVVLEPENPQYRPLVFWENDMNKVRVLGRAVAFTSCVR